MVSSLDKSPITTGITSSDLQVIIAELYKATKTLENRNIADLTPSLTEMKFDEFLNLQKTYCIESGYECVPADFYSKVGFALQTMGREPINGLRHPPDGGTNGWYIWCGQSYSTEPDFFSPLHTIHLNEYCPQIMKFLGLPPGFRFMLAADWIDVWFDAKLLLI